MRRLDIERELRRYNAGAMTINQTEIMQARHKGRAWVRELTEGLPCWREGRTVEYMVRDVAERMFERMNAEEGQ